MSNCDKCNSKIDRRGFSAVDGELLCVDCITESDASTASDDLDNGDNS